MDSEESKLAAEAYTKLQTNDLSELLEQQEAHQEEEEANEQEEGHAGAAITSAAAAATVIAADQMAKEDVLNQASEQAQKNSEESAQRQAEAQAQKEAEEKAKQEADEQADAKAQSEQEKAKQEPEEQAKKPAEEEAAKREAEEEARKEEEQRRLEEERKAEEAREKEEYKKAAALATAAAAARVQAEKDALEAGHLAAEEAKAQEETRLAAESKQREEADNEEAKAALTEAAKAVQAGDQTIHALASKMELRKRRIKSGFDQESGSGSSSEENSEEDGFVIGKKKKKRRGPRAGDSDFASEDGEPKFSSDRFIWDQWEINKINRMLKTRSQDLEKPQYAGLKDQGPLPFVKRLGSRQKYGIRAHWNLEGKHCFFSMGMWQNNELLAFYFVLIFAVCFWLHFIMAVAAVGEYEAISRDSDRLLVAESALAVAVSYTLTLFFILYYSLGERAKFLLGAAHMIGIYLMIYALLGVFIALEIMPRQPTTGICLTIGVGLAFLLCAGLSLASGQAFAWTAVAITTVVILVVLGYDLIFLATPRHKSLVYLPLIVVSIIAGVAYLLYLLRVPESWAPRNQGVQLFFTSYLILLVCVFALLIEVQRIMVQLARFNGDSASGQDQGEEARE